MLTYEQKQMDLINNVARIDEKEGVVFMTVEFSKLTSDQFEAVHRLRCQGWIIQYNMF